MSHCITVAITLRVMDFLKPVNMAEFFAGTRKIHHAERDGYDNSDFCRARQYSEHKKE